MRSSLVRVFVLLAFGGAVAVACTIGGEEGDRCNPLVERDECQGSNHCTAFSCTESYCCPTDHKSSDPHCNATNACPDEDAGDEGGSEAGVEAGGDDAGNDAGEDAVAEAGSDADAGDAATD